MQLRCAKDENERLLLELRELKSTAVGSEAASELKQLRKQIRQKDAEIRALSDQLLPAKQKLVEYMAMADRLGLSYPFPSELEGATVMRLRSLQKGNKTTAPSEHSSPPPPKTTKTKSKRTRKVEFPDEDDLR
ncbi:hypothetical protein AGDE_15101 [Angomonas deanei]|uniref:Uncharacterized protein n=1 Tax=Angomonas deanei TaxID=59799 RepID=A0A7G2CPB4_9TRYP|nr:hypothetical protein AGDE_15101 [Angomonas deanei]CAD2221345.1 hypothetical protein, conserved [Angomonas deanei]|eukprot:EPY19686.1 hypothetical protein AGDE_15101 [Angomonas deanei]